MATGDKFQRGDFLRKDSKKGSFMIYEGNNLSDTAYKRMSLVCYYDPEKFMMGPVGYEQQPNLELATKYKPCETTIDTEEEDYWIKKCNDREKQTAMDILAKNKLYWDEENFELISLETGETIRKIIIPDNTYYGQVVRPKNDKFKELLKKWCIKKIPPVYTYERCYDYYDD